MWSILSNGAWFRLKIFALKKQVFRKATEKVIEIWLFLLFQKGVFHFIANYTNILTIKGVRHARNSNETFCKSLYAFI